MTSGHRALSVGRACFLRVDHQVYEVEILALAKDTIGVSLPLFIELEEGMGVDLEVHDATGVICYHTQVVTGNHPGAQAVILQRSESAAHRRHRRSWRVPVDLPIQMAPESGIPNRDGRLIDLSIDGARLTSLAALKSGDECRITARFGKEKAYVIPGRIIYAADGDGPADYLYGVRFEDVPARVRRALTWYLYERIRLHYIDELRALYPRPNRPPRIEHPRKTRTQPAV